MHRLLKRQVRKFLKQDYDDLPEAVRAFVDAVGQTYEQCDEDRAWVERSMDLSHQELLRANSELRVVFRTLPDLFVRIDRDGQVLDCSGGKRSDFMFEPQKLLGKRLQDVPVPEVAQLFQDAIHQVDAEAETVVREYALFSEAVNALWYYEARLVPILEDQIIVIVRNITENKKAEKEVEESLSVMKATLESTADGILVVDADGKIQSYNQKFVAMWGVPDDVLARRDDSRAIEYVLDHFENRNDFLFKIDELYKSPNVESHDTLVLKDGRVFDRYSKPQMIGASVVGRVWSFRDVTENRRAQEALLNSEKKLRQSQKMQAIGTLAGGIAHDFNNILWIIIGNVELGLRRISKGRAVDESILNEIFSASKRAEALVNQILTFSRQDDEERRPVEVHTICNEAIRLLKSTLPSTISIEPEIDSASGRVIADPTQIHQVVVNLCTNAFHAMERGGTLSIRLNTIDVDATMAQEWHELESGSFIELCVEDTGCGMDKNTMERIFEPFFTTKEVGEGTGLGLATVHGIVTRLQGAIRVSSECGKGTQFRVFFPKADAVEVEEGGSHALNGDEGGSEQILVVDDEKQVIYMLEKYLEVLGYSVTAFRDSVCAWEAFKAAPHAFDLILTDQTMPGLTGTELLQKVRCLRPDIPVVLATGFSKSVSEEIAAQLGINQFLRKPVHLGELEAAIRNALDRH